MATTRTEALCRKSTCVSHTRKTIQMGILCLYLSTVSLSARAFSIPRQIQSLTSSSPSQSQSRMWASRASTISYTNGTSVSSSYHRTRTEPSFPARIVGKRLRDPEERKQKVLESTQRNVRNNRRDAGSWYQREEMLQHDILTKEEEFGLGNAIIHAKQLRDQMADIIETMRMEEDENNLEELLWGNGDGGVDAVWPSIHLEGMEAMSTYDIPLAEQKMNDPFDSSWGQSLENRNYEGDSRISSTLVQDGSKLNRQAVEADLRLLTDEDVRTKMNLEGGKEELIEILALGSEARTTLMKSNIRLVVSIGKKWMGSSFAAGNSNGASTINLNNGGWDRPSLDEVIQEGILGLTRAVDKFDPSRGLRFSTYSTHWITSYVRQCFQSASTGCLQVPSQLHEIKNSYKSLVKQYVDSSEPIPSEEAIAAEIGVSLNRLLTAMRATEALLSLDEPAFNSGNSAYKGSGAGGDNAGDSNLLLSDRLQCTELAPEEYVEISFLRQSLENAMAAELSPHERDVLRMRLGLDDGNTRTVKQIVEFCGGGVTVSDVRAAERRAFKKLRSPNVVHAHNLAHFMEMIGVDFETRRW